MNLLQKGLQALRPNPVWSVALLEAHDDDPFAIARARLRHLMSSRCLRRSSRHVHTRADPFLFQHENMLFLFAEIQEARGKGHIAAYELDHQLVPRSLGPILVEPHHLSYPMVFNHGDQIHLVPESSEVREIALYTFRDFPRGLERTRALLSGAPYADTTVHFDGTYWWLFTCLGEELHLFFAPGLDGVFTPHPCNPVCTNPAYSRCGGPVVRWNGHSYRLGQDGRSSYGADLSALEILELTPERYRERLSYPSLFHSRKTWNALGAHHLSVARFGGRTIIAVDGRQSDYWLNKPLSLLMRR